MPDIRIEQALYGAHDAGGYRFLARSPGFQEEWLPEAQRLCSAFGERPTGVACPTAVFARPLDNAHVAIVQVADQGSDDAGRPGALAFRLLVLAQSDYVGLGGDPFVLADRLPPSWDPRGELPVLSVPAETPPPRTIAQVQEVFKRYQTMQPTLLGAVQTLVDGGHVVFERSEPDTDLLRSLWTLLPINVRAESWPASFAFGNALHFDVLVTPKAQGVDFSGYVREEHAADYPEGRYELGLQLASEDGDQGALDRLLTRRSPRDVRRLALLLIAAVLVLVVVFGILSPRTSETPPATEPAAVVAEKPNLDGPDQPWPFSEPERKVMTEALAGLAKDLKVPTPQPETAEGLLDALDKKLDTPNKSRDPGKLSDQGPAPRRLRVLLWKHGVAEYNDPKYNAKELVERLRRRVVKTTGKES
jgi:GTPase-associated protein 1, N-terminal domain type 2